MSNVVELVKEQEHPKRYNREVFDDLKRRERDRANLKQLALSLNMIMAMMRDFDVELEKVRRDFEYGDFKKQGGAV